MYVVSISHASLICEFEIYFSVPFVLYFFIPCLFSCQIRVVIYLVLAAAEDDETQKRGLIGMFYFTNVVPLIQNLYERKPNLFDWLPIKFVGAHFCCDDARFRIVHALLLLLMGKKRRVRVRIHEGTLISALHIFWQSSFPFLAPPGTQKGSSSLTRCAGPPHLKFLGSHTECQYKLMTFGVPVSHLPVSYEGTLKTAAHLKWLARRVVKETALQSVGKFDGIDLPRAYDVLLGRGKTVQDHSGNVILRRLIAEFMPEYRNAPKKEKGSISRKVVLATKMLGGRFLKRGPNGWWVEVSEDMAKEKISMAYRTSRVLSESPMAATVSGDPVGTDLEQSHLLEPASKKLKETHAREQGGVVDYSSKRRSSSISNNIGVCLGILES